MSLLPPSDIPPERLFRLLLARPRPTLAIAFRLPFAPDVALSVRGLTALEDAALADVDPAMPEAVRRSEVTSRLIAAHLLADGVPAFASPEDVGALDETEVDALFVAVFRAAQAISPQYRTASEQWADVLQQGAKHRSNRALTSTIAACTDTVVAPRAFVNLSAPDRYFGIPYADLTDGQIMAYQAAKKVCDRE